MVKVSRWNIQFVWPSYYGSIKRAADENPEVDPMRVKADLQAGGAQLWNCPGGVMVTRVDSDYDAKTFVVCLLSGYGFFKWGPDLDRETQEIARGYGCNKIKIIGRRAWEKLLKPFGYSFQVIEMCKRI